MTFGLCEAHAWLRKISIMLIKRFLDIVVSFSALVVAFIPLLMIALAVRITSPGPALYWSKRVGRDNKLFQMPKFRTMGVGTPAVATHLLDNPDRHLTSLGGFLRKTSLDELPQLWCILRGHMSLVGPRPALFNQEELIARRTEVGVHLLTPGLTGWAQVNGRDELAIPLKVAFDAEYRQKQSFWFDLRILWLTAIKVLAARGVSH